MGADFGGVWVAPDTCRASEALDSDKLRLRFKFSTTRCIEIRPEVSNEHETKEEDVGVASDGRPENSLRPLWSEEDRPVAG